MAEMILPGVYIEVRDEGLIAPGQVTVGNLGVVGTAAKGPIGKPVILGSFTDALQSFYNYDPWGDGTGDKLTLTRALEQAFDHGATTVFAVRVAGASKSKATYTLTSATGNAAVLTAKSEGTWGNDLSVNVAALEAADDFPFISGEKHDGNAAGTLTYHPVVKNARNRISLHVDSTGITKSLKILYDGDPAPAAGEVRITRAGGTLEFGDALQAADKVTASYVVDKTIAVKVTLKFGNVKEVFTAVDGINLAANIGTDDINSQSAWVFAAQGTKPAELPSKSVPDGAFAQFKGGDDGAGGADYEAGLAVLLNEEAHIIVAAGQDDSFGAKLDLHCQVASGDTIKHDRIAVVGSKLNASVDDLRGHTLDSDRVIFVAPGIRATDRAATPPVEVTLPGAYAAAAVAGLVASFPAHISLTNKPLGVDGLEQRFTSAELTQLVQNRVLALEQRQGFRVVRGITTALTDPAFSQITTRRIVDFAKSSVRSGANPYLGRLNNVRVRAALKSTLDSALKQMLDDEMLVAFTVEVTATRAEEIKGIARVTITLQPTFSIDFIKVTMFLQ